LAGLEVMVQGEFKKAQSHFSAALGDNPREDSAYFLQDISREAAAGKIKKQAALLFAQGFLAVTNGDGPSALKYFLQCKDADPNFWQGELFAANLMAGAGQKAEAEKLLHGILKRNPKSAHTYVSLGLLAADRHNPQEARRYFEKAIEANPEFAQAHYQLGMVALYSDDLKTAEREFKQTIVLDPYSEEGHNNLGLVYFFLGRPAEAAKEYKTAAELNPSYPDAHVNLGNLYVQQKQYNLAIDEYAKALAIDPDFAAAHNNMAGAYVLMEKWPEAIQAADTALKLGYPVPKSLLAKLAPHRK
jgi:tetratricopeptide (TPR) repeat protein